MNAPSILIAEDEGIVAHDLASQLRALGYGVSGIAESGNEALRLCEQHHPDLVLMDVRLKGAMDGIETAQLLRTRLHLPVVYLTAHADASTLERAKLTEPYGYLLKPFHERELRTVIEMAVYKHRAERNLQASELRFAETLAAITEGVIAAAGGQGVVFANPAAGRLLRRPAAELVGRPLAEVLPLRGEVGPQLSVTTLGPFRGTVRRGDGTEMVVEGRASPMAGTGDEPTSVFVFRDVSEEQRLAEQRRAESAEDEPLLTFAALADDAAEDLNGLLAAMSEDAERLVRQPLQDEGRELARRIQAALRQAADLTGHLLAHAARPFLARERVDLVQIAEEAKASLLDARAKNVVLNWHLADVPAADGDPRQLGRLLAGLVARARAGLGARGGVIRVSVGVQLCDREFLSTCVLDDEHPAGDYVFLEVADDGPPVGAEVVPRLIDPFLAPGPRWPRGGLAVALGIVRAHGGLLHVDVAPGHGNVVRVLLPVAR